MKKKARAKMETKVDHVDDVTTYDFHVEVLDADLATTSNIAGLSPPAIRVPLYVCWIASLVFLAYGVVGHASWAQSASWAFIALALAFERWIWKVVAHRTVVALVTATNAQLRTVSDGKSEAKFDA